MCPYAECNEANERIDAMRGQLKSVQVGATLRCSYYQGSMALHRAAQGLHEVAWCCMGQKTRNKVTAHAFIKVSLFMGWCELDKAQQLQKC